MALVNYVKECQAFMEYAVSNALSAGEHLLWRAIFHIMNRNAKGAEWPDDFLGISNPTMLSYFPMSEDTMEKARGSLSARGIILYEPGQRNKRPPRYKLMYFSTQEDTANSAEGYPLSADNLPGNLYGNVPANCQGNDTRYRLCNPPGNGRDIIDKLYRHQSKPSQIRCLDEAWRTSARVRSKVAQDILNAWGGDKSGGYDSHRHIVEYLEKDMTPDQIENVLKDCEEARCIPYHLHTEALYLGIDQECDAPAGY